jgi:hypothetical protein
MVKATPFQRQAGEGRVRRALLASENAIRLIPGEDDGSARGAAAAASYNAEEEDETEEETGGGFNAMAVFRGKVCDIGFCVLLAVC